MSWKKELINVIAPLLCVGIALITDGNMLTHVGCYLIGFVTFGLMQKVR